jgi:HPt (histidine-containing phosphotransfer) domain-containing protein
VNGDLDLYLRMLHALLDDSDLNPCQLPFPVPPSCHIQPPPAQELDNCCVLGLEVAPWHKLSGVAGMLGLTRLQAYAAEIETQWRTAHIPTPHAACATCTASTPPPCNPLPLLLNEIRTQWLPLLEQARDAMRSPSQPSSRTKSAQNSANRAPS